MRTCLIADPSHLARRAAGSVCGRLGFHAMEVTSSDGLKKAYRRFHPALTLIDVSVAEADIGPLIVSLRYGLGGGKGLILLTGHDLESTVVEEAMIAGADDVLRKPIDDALLSRKLQQLENASRVAVGQSEGWPAAARSTLRTPEYDNVIQIADWR
jgi:DNA-binding response OmpR family regulator